MIDTHTHLGDAQFGADRDTIIREAFDAGVEFLVEIADGPKEWDKALRLTRHHPGKISCAWGLHPHYAGEWKDEFALRFSQLNLSPLVSAIGEIGIDYAKSRAPRDTQMAALKLMLHLASENQRPIVLHCREGQEGRAHEDLFQVLEKEWEPNLGDRRFHGVLHCFSGGPDEASRAAALNLALGVDGPITYPKNDALRETIHGVGLKRLVLETDSPYLPPQSIRGQRNEPSKLKEIAEKLSEIFNVSLQEVIKITSLNARDLFNL